jgi:hypothetical protein
LTNVLIVVSNGQIDAVYASESNVRTFLLNYDAEGRDLSTREQQCIMLGFPHDAPPEAWDLDPPDSEGEGDVELVASADNNRSGQ